MLKNIYCIHLIAMIVTFLEAEVQNSAQGEYLHLNGMQLRVSICL